MGDVNEIRSVTTRSQIVAAARMLVAQRVPFLHQGRDPATGLDCAGVVAVALGVAAPPATYTMQTAGCLLLTGMRVAGLLEIPVAQARPGDAIVYRVGRLPRHVAILTDIDTIVHAHDGGGRVVETSRGEPWASREHTAFMLPGLPGLED